jgi:beta-galactosidase
MARASFNKDWTVRPPVGAYAAALGAGRPPQAVTLPHDAMIGLERSAQNGSGCGYFSGGVFEYNKTFEAPENYRSRAPGQWPLTRQEGDRRAESLQSRVRHPLRAG